MPIHSHQSRFDSVTRLGLLLRVLVFWTGWFVVARLIFLCYEWRQARTLNLPLFAGLWLHGLRMDLSTAAYLTVVPWLLLVMFGHAKPETLRRAMIGYFALALAFTSLVTVADLQLFVEWRYRLDSTLIHFLRTPDEALASSASAPWISLSFLLLGLIAASVGLARTTLLRSIESGPRTGLGTALVTLALGTTLIIPIRGGLQWTPMNPSFAYFSNNDFANQAALNASWHFAHATLEAAHEPTSNPYQMLAPTEARAVVDSMLKTVAAPRTRLLRVQRPNIILIVWESLTAKVVTRLGGTSGVTPQFDRLTHSGIFFDSLFASAGRTPQGIVALLSAFPAQPHQQILELPRAVATLPMLGKSLGADGWHTSFYYGGELEFANLQSYASLGRFSRVVSENDFASRDRNSKWGAHDHVVLGRALDDMATDPRPFFSTVLTLSSHEPFDVPEAPAFSGTSEDTLFMNAHHYTDASIGSFINAARQQPWWDSTLVIIVADHGSPRPVPDPIVDERVPDRYHIPMLWLGGALAVQDTVIHTVGSQLDVSPTLLAQLGRTSSEYTWGKDIMTQNDGGFAYFAYHDGFAFIDARGWMVYDELAHTTVQSGGRVGVTQQRRGSAMLQASFDEFLSRWRSPTRSVTAGQ
ncbi:MAG: LTA synthase family protein [Gemmatimonadaceae bacterium]